MISTFSSLLDRYTSDTFYFEIIFLFWNYITHNYMISTFSSLLDRYTSDTFYFEIILLIIIWFQPFPAY